MITEYPVNSEITDTGSKMILPVLWLGQFRVFVNLEKFLLPFCFSADTLDVFYEIYFFLTFHLRIQLFSIN